MVILEALRPDLHRADILPDLGAVLPALLIGKPEAPVRDTFTSPARRQQRLQVALHQPPAGVILGKLLLLFTGKGGQVIRQGQGLPLAVSDNGFRPKLIYDRLGEVIPDGERRGRLLQPHGPETAVAGIVPQEGGGVGGAEEHALTGVFLHPRP